jgi:transcriptional regulator with XRE-family HTH domain
MTRGEIIRARRKSLSMSQASLADAVGTNQQTIDKIERGMTEHSRFLRPICAVLGISLDELDPLPALGPAAGLIPGEALRGARDLPVHAAAEGGKGQLVVSSDPVDWVLRPAPLAHVKGGYGLIIVGESMIPEFEPGDIALINPHLPPEKTCVFYAERQDGEVRATVKRLVKATVEAWLVRQWNPPEGDKPEFRLLRSEWNKSHCTVGKYSRR